MSVTNASVTGQDHAAPQMTVATGSAMPNGSAAKRGDQLSKAQNHKLVRMSRIVSHRG